VDNLTSASFSSILKVATKAKIPVFGFVESQVTDGAIAAVSRDYVQAGKDAVRLAVRIFRGENPKNIPFEHVSKTNVVINKLAAAKAGISIPAEILEKADKIITE
jgi:putative ABC transport system substrate-binding protein